MTLNEYQALALRTESPVTPEVRDRFRDVRRAIMHVLHNPTAEKANVLKRYVFYGRPLADQWRWLFQARESHREDGTPDVKLCGYAGCKRVPLIHDDDRTIRLCHALLGIISEVGELAATVLGTAPLPEGQTFETNVSEECGDLSWYNALALDAVGVSADDAGRANIAKLATRYADKFAGSSFSPEAAADRDLAAEARVLSESFSEKPDPSLWKPVKKTGKSTIYEYIGPPRHPQPIYCLPIDPVESVTDAHDRAERDE